MKRIFYLALCLFAITAITFSFVACGGDTSDGGTGTTAVTPSGDTGSTVGSGTGDTNGGTTDTSGNTTDTSNVTTKTENNVTDTSIGTTDSSKGTTGTDDNTTDTNPGTTDTTNQGSQDVEKPDDPEPPHEHTFADEYSFDGGYHYYASTCGHPEEMIGYEPHTYDSNGSCKCGQTIDLNFHNVVKAILANISAIKSVDSKYTSNNLEFGSVGVQTVICRFYEKFLYINDEADYKNEYYYAYNENGTIFGVCVQSALDDQSGNSFVFRVTDATESNFNGAMYTLACIGDAETIVFGTEALIDYLYMLGLDNANGDFATAEEGGVYTFSFMHCIVDDWMDYLYQINVSFTLDSESGALATSVITVNRYGKSSYTVNENGKYVLNDGATPNMTNEFDIQQSTTLDDAGMENPYAPERIAVDSLTIKDSKDVNIQKAPIRVRAGESIRLFFTDIKPDTALFKLCKVTFKLMNAVDGTEIDIEPFPNDYDSSYAFSIDTPGAYTLIINVDDVQFVSTVEVDLKIPVSIGTQVYDTELGTFKQTRKATVYAGAPLYFTSYVPLNYDGAYKTSFGAQYGEGVTLTDGEINGTAVSVFKADAVGTYVVNVSSDIDPYLVTQLKINVVEAPTLESLLVGEYYAKDAYGKEQVRIVFDSEHNALVTYPAFETDETLACSVVDGKIVFESIDGDEGLVTGLRFDENYNLIISIDDSSVGEILLTRVKVEETIVSSGTLTVKYASTELGVVQYAYEYYSTNRFVIYKEYSLVTEVALFKENGVLSFRYVGADGAVELTRVSGEDGALAGEYAVPSVVELLITVDETPTAVQEPQYGVLQIIDLDTSDEKYSAYYLYEIVNGNFVFYRDGEVTDEVKLTGEPGALMLTYPGASYAISPEKTVGEDDILGGEYNVNVNVGMLLTIAKVVVVPGATMEDIYSATEAKYGTLYIDDADGIRHTYNYEIVNGIVVVFKDGRKTNEVEIIVNLDGTYSYKTSSMNEAVLLVKVEGNDKMFTGVYSANDTIITVSAGTIPSEPIDGTIEIVDYHCNGNLTGVYAYSIINGSIVLYDRDGNLFEGVKFTTNIDGTYSFQSLANNLLVPQALNKVDGMSVLLGGVYNINGENGVAYVLTFVPGGEIKDVILESGSVDITSDEEGLFEGAFIYELTDRGIVKLYRDGELLAGFIITVDENGVCTFTYEGMVGSAVLVKVGGEIGMLSGVYTMAGVDGVAYEVVFMAQGYEMPEAAQQEVVLGKNEITVPGNFIGTFVKYTADKDIKLDFTFTGKVASDMLYIVKADGALTQIASTSYAGVELKNGESITFFIVSTEANEHVMSINIAVSKIEMPDDEF